MKGNPILLCWSDSNCGVRYESLADYVHINLRAFRENRRVDFVPIAAFDTVEEAHSYFEAHCVEFLRRYDARRRRQMGRFQGEDSNASEAGDE